MKNKLSTQEVNDHLSNLDGWIFLDDYIEKKFIFRNFSEAFGFIGRVALLSEKLEHHPDWSGVYNVVQIKLNTHEVGGVTYNDILMAKEINKLIFI